MTHARCRRWLVPTLGALATLFHTSGARAGAVVVPGDFPTLQAAVDAHEERQDVDTIYVSPGVVEDSVHAIAQSTLAIIGLGDSLTCPKIGAMRVGGRSYWLVTLKNLRFTGEFQTAGKAAILFDSCRIDGGLTSPIQGSLRELEFRHCVVASRMWFGFDSFVDIDSCRFEAGTVHKNSDGHLTVTHSSFEGPSSDAAIGGSEDARLRVEDVRITGYASGIVHNGHSGTLTARSNHIESCGTGISLRIDGGLVVGNTIVGSANDGLNGVVVGYGIDVERNVVLGSGGRGVVLDVPEYSQNRFVSNTVASNQGSGFDLHLQPSPTSPAAALFTNNIGYGNDVGLRFSGDPSGLAMSCNDWFANDSAAVVGVAASATDLFVDPRFCDLDPNDVHLLNESPLVDAPGCGLIGARGVGCGSTSTLVTWFTADRVAEGVRIAWRLADDDRFGDVWLERSESRVEVWERVAGLVNPEGDAHATLDRSARADRSYSYRLVAREDDRTFVLGSPIEVSSTAFALGMITPNPARGPLLIEFSLALESPIDLDVFDVAGRHVARLTQGTRPAGTHSVAWNARVPGVYLVRCRYPGGETTRRVVRL